MRKYRNDLIFILFVMFSMASGHILQALFSESQALEIAAEFAQASASNDERLDIALINIDDFGKHRERSGRIIAGKTAILKEMAELLAILQANIRLYSIALAVCILGVVVTGTIMYSVLRAQAKQLVRQDA